ncbi:hypothetical protein [Halobaculum sp. MBLA0143]|uniref:hypothetical protein n=1 Tax=Halobaculum sp. MBLA0143 TaxID=3079933 RepID=UPI003525175E
MARNESTRQSRALGRLRAGARLVITLALVVGLLTAQVGSVAATGGEADATTSETDVDVECGFWSALLDWLGLVDNGCASALENGMIGIGP